VAVSAVEAGESLTLKVLYLNPLVQSTEISYTGKLPRSPSSPRNGNTMGHSRQSAAALLDLYLFRIGGRATITIDGERRKIVPLLGLVPQRFLLAQVQAGVAVTNFRQESAEGGFSLERPGNGAPWPTESDEHWTVEADGWVRRDGPVVSLAYRFVEGELERAVAVQAGEATPLLTMVFQPRLPDLRRPFDGVAESRFVADINGQEGHGTGVIRTQWINGMAQVEFVPLAPAWFADRPMRGQVRYEGGAAYVTMERTDVDPR
jgi:hypothetical protein